MKTADQYIGDYTYKELAFEIKKEDWVVDESGRRPPCYETDVDLSFMDFNDDVGFLIETESNGDDGSTVYLSCTPPSLVSKGNVSGPNGFVTIITGLMLDISGILENEVIIQIVLNVDTEMTPKETGGFIMFEASVIPTSFKVYKITKSLGKRVSAILDEINGEVV